LILGLTLALPAGGYVCAALLALVHLHPDKDFHPDFCAIVCPGLLGLLGLWFIVYSTRAFRRGTRTVNSGKRRHRG
jgi:hypothetical protein